MLSSKKGPSAHILIGAICFLIHICDSSQGHKGWKRVQTRDAPGESTKSGQTPQSRFLTSEEEPGILLPADDKYNFVGQDDATTETIWRTGRSSSPLPPRTIVSTNSYSIRPGSSSNSGGSTFTVNAKPVPMVTTGSSYTVKTDGEKYFPYLPKNSNKSTVFVKNNCFGHRCPPENSNADRHQSGDDDEWKSYHYVLNKGVKHNNNKQRKMYNSGDRPSRRNNEADSYSGLMHEMSLSVPFRVDPTISKYDTSYPHKFARRVLRTTTPSSSSSMSTTTPGWVKLQPILPDQYDPFTLKSNKNKLKNKSHQESNKVNPASQFANRRGVELDPDSFAERWGWGDQNNDNNGGGSRYPAWLQGVDNNNNNNNGAGGSDRDRDWVKLEPIPVAAVTISKWVPKGTPNSDLPSTNWPTRDRVSSSNGIGQQPPTNTKWWEIIDNINRRNQNRPPQYDNRPPQYGPNPSVSNSYDSPPRGWTGPNKASSSSSSLSSWERDRSPQNSWGDVIYPNGPASATVSWQQDKDMSKYPSSFPPSTSSSPWQSDIRRPSSSATGSWSSDRDSYGSSYGGNRRQGSATYPDRHTTEDDPRWVLVSNSKKVTVSASSDSNRHHPSYPESSGIKYRPDFDKFSDFPFYEQPPYKNRRGKNYKDLVTVTNITVTKPSSNYLDQDAAFSKINATLASLTPVLNRKRVYRGTISDSKKTSSAAPSTTSSSSPPKKPGFMKQYFGDGRGNKEPSSTTVLVPSTTVLVPSTTTTVASGNVVRKGLSINPVYAAVGAGMIPATMAAILPIALGRRRRDVRFLIKAPFGDYVDQSKEGMSEERILKDFLYFQKDNHLRSGVPLPRRRRSLDYPLFSISPNSFSTENHPNSHYLRLMMG